ncbi:hypothetical protein HAX54_052187, partial [Datura stramonium]|nr:hypothetical protein [Datura stramonium]
MVEEDISISKDEPKYHNYGIEEEKKLKRKSLQAQQLEVYGNHHDGISRLVEDFLKEHAEQSQEVELLEIATQILEAKLNNVMIEACNVQHQMVMGSSFESSLNEEEVKMDFEEL